MNVKKHIKENQLFWKEYLIILILMLGTLFGIYKDYMGVTMLPLGLVISIFIFTFPATGLYLIALLLPFSINISFSGITINTPLEPLLLIIAGTTVFNLLYAGIDRTVLSHPLTRLVLLFICLIFLSCCFSSAPLISFRIALQTMLYITASYFGLLWLSQTNVKLPQRFLSITLFSFSALAAIIFFKHSTYGFSRTVAWLVPNPFYTDHTIYSAMAAFMTPLAFVSMLWYYKKSFWKCNLCAILFLTCTSALILSYSRAAMISVIAAFCLFIVLRYKIRWSYIGIAAVVSLLYFISVQESVFMQMRRNNADSKTKETSVEDQLKSITNVNNDVSNLERINRWSAAIRMIKDKPFLGFGYGMYQHKYFPYQKESEMTYISIKNSQAKYEKGTGGTTHSEYLLISSENGIFTGIVYIALLVMSLYITFKITTVLTPQDFNYYAVMGIGMSITTYLVHSFFNNFLDTSKICAIFFGMLACLVTIDLSNLTKHNTVKQ